MPVQDKFDMVVRDRLQSILVEMLQRGIDGMDAGARRREAFSWEHGKYRSRWADRKGPVQINHKDLEELLELGLVEDKGNGSLPIGLTPAGVEFALRHATYQAIDIQAAIEHVLNLPFFCPSSLLNGDVAIPAIYRPGTSRMVLVLGENAGGKSFFRRLFRLATHPGRSAGMGQKAIPKGPFPVREFIPLSMQDRTSNGFLSSMVYGVEESMSTGQCSSRTVTTGVRTVKERTHPTIIWWDEPDIGMSAGVAGGTGVAIKNFAETASSLVQAVFVTSHSVPLVRQLKDLDPHYVYLGDADGPSTLEAWFESQRDPPLVSPDEIQDRARRRHGMIRILLDGER
jgi:hypothetical protein